MVRFDRRGLVFEPGQHLNLGLRGALAMREYSIYSAAEEDFLEVLVREVDGGAVSPALKRCGPGDRLSMEGPYGIFVTDGHERPAAPYLFVGSGTGIAPFHSIVRSYPDIHYRILHGVRTEQERYDFEAFDRSRYLCCTSRSSGGDYAGRVTAWLREHPVEPEVRCYLCGNSDMIYEAFAILRGQGVPREHLFAEVYF